MGQTTSKPTPEQLAQLIDTTPLNDIVKLFRDIQTEYTGDLTPIIERILARSPTAGTLLILYTAIGDGGKPGPTVAQTKLFIQKFETSFAQHYFYNAYRKQPYTDDQVAELTALTIEHTAPTHIKTLYHTLAPKTIQLTRQCLLRCKLEDIIEIIPTIPPHILAESTIAQLIRYRCLFRFIRRINLLLPPIVLSTNPQNRLLTIAPSNFLAQWPMLHPLTALERIDMLKRISQTQLIQAFALCQRFVPDVPAEIATVLDRIKSCPTIGLKIYYHVLNPTEEQTTRFIAYIPRTELNDLQTSIMLHFTQGALQRLTTQLIKRCIGDQLIQIIRIAGPDIEYATDTILSAFDTISPQRVIDLVMILPIHVANRFAVREKAKQQCVPVMLPQLVEYFDSIFDQRFVPTVRALTIADFTDQKIIPTEAERARVIAMATPIELITLSQYLTDPTYDEYFTILERIDPTGLFAVFLQIADPSFEMRKIVLTRAHADALHIFAHIQDPTGEEIDIMVKRAIAVGLSDTPVSIERYKNQLLHYAMTRAVESFLQIKPVDVGRYKLPQYIATTPIQLDTCECYDYTLSDVRNIETMTIEDYLYIFIIGKVSFCVTHSDIVKVFVDTDNWFYTCVYNTTIHPPRYEQPPTINPTAPSEQHHPDYTHFEPYCTFLGYHIPVYTLYAILQPDDEPITDAMRAQYQNAHDAAQQRLHDKYVNQFTTILQMDNFDELHIDMDTINAAWDGNFYSLRQRLSDFIADRARSDRLVQNVVQIKSIIRDMLTDNAKLPGLLVDLCAVLKLSPDTSIPDIVTKLDMIMIPPIIASLNEADEPTLHRFLTRIRMLLREHREIAVRSTLPRKYIEPFDELTQIYKQHIWVKNLNIFTNHKDRIFIITQSTPPRQFDQIVDQIQFSPRVNYVSRNHCKGDSRILSSVSRVSYTHVANCMNTPYFTT